MKKILFLSLWLPASLLQLFAQPNIKWTADGSGYYNYQDKKIVLITLPKGEEQTIASESDLTPPGKQEPFEVEDFHFSKDQRKILLFTHTRKVWRLNTQGNYWVLDLTTHKLRQLGLSQPPATLRFAKFSPDGSKVAYVSENDLFIEDLITGRIRMITTDRSKTLINGTFDWAYEEEFACRDGFQWSPDGGHIAFWQVDAANAGRFYMINNTDSVYSKIIPLEYPTVGHSPSSVKIGVVRITNDPVQSNTPYVINWLKIPGTPNENYLPRMEWNSPGELLVQQLNRKQNECKLYVCRITGEVKLIYQEKDQAWIDVYSPWEDVYSLDFRHHVRWINKGNEFLWTSEKDGWRHVYRIAKDGTKETLVTKGNFDVMDVLCIDEPHNQIYFYASPDNATQKYLYKTKLDGTGKAELVTPKDQSGTHSYVISPTGLFAFHVFSNTYTQPISEWISLPTHQSISQQESIKSKIEHAKISSRLEFIKVKTEEGVEMDAWVVKPKNFDPQKKYPVLFYVYTEPWGANVKDEFGVGRNGLFNGNLSEEGYFYISIDNRGTPAPKGSAWRKSIYRKIGILNISDQALAAKEILKWPYIDKERVAVWGWSGGGSATLNLMFQYPQIYKTGIAIAAVANQLTYDNIYQERYMGLPQENPEDFINGSPITYAKNLEGNLLYIHGTGDDNVHYSNAEMLINELVKYNKQFQFMPYPNRTHGIYEGEGTSKHLSTLFSNYLRTYCPPGPR